MATEIKHNLEDFAALGALVWCLIVAEVVRFGRLQRLLSPTFLPGSGLGTGLEADARTV